MIKLKAEEQQVQEKKICGSFIDTDDHEKFEFEKMNAAINKEENDAD